MLDRQPEVPDERRIRWRIGINLGDVIAEPVAAPRLGSVGALTQLATALAGRVLDDMTDSATADIQRAEIIVGKALGASPYYPGAHWARGQLLRAQGRPAEAIFGIRNG